MTTARAIAVPTLLLAAAAALMACGATGDRPPAPAAPAGPSVTGSAPTGPSPTGPGEAPSMTSGPPKSPTDRISNDGSVVGTVTRGGPGPCFGLVTDDGTEYALHDTDGRTLTKGTRVRVHLGPARYKIDCGAGRPMQLRNVEPL